jgi:S-phase kinase-associated protein 1
MLIKNMMEDLGEAAMTQSVPIPNVSTFNLTFAPP